MKIIRSKKFTLKKESIIHNLEYLEYIIYINI